MISAHQEVCGQDVLASCGMDKRYYSNANHKYLQSLEGLKEFCLQQPGLDISRRGDLQVTCQSPIGH
jgi:hypothetical protein